MSEEKRKRPDLSEIPSIEALKEELMRETVRREFSRTLLNIAGGLVVIAAITALMVTRIFVLIQISGESMSPTMEDGEIVFIRQTEQIEIGDVVGFYYGGKILLKRVIAGAGDDIEIDVDGNVSVNGTVIDEPYLSGKMLGTCEQEFPLEIPGDTVFVLGDNRGISVDSRIKSIGCVKKEQIVGKVVFRMWPLARLGIMH
ncbi:MAG: signal peptidase I [Dorea sp.]|jgi:signal peptidase I|nr:signal peptidase I [Dorea sp.]